MASPDTVPAPLRIPAILQNPVNRAQKQVEAHNAQQREKVEAKRERVRESRIDLGGGKGDKRGKRVIRRVDNAAFTSNPHIVRPSRADYYPSYPLNPHPPIPLNTLPRSTSIPGIEPPAKDPYSTSSVNGAFSTSIKGIRQALRKKGRRTEVVVQKVESEIRGWLSGIGTLHDGDRVTDECREDKWRVVDDTLVEHGQQEVSDQGPSNGREGTSSRRIPARHRQEGALPCLPLVDGLVPAILELSRSAGHLSWLAMEGFERLVIHLICRYYEVVSWSEDHTTISGEKVRLTHIIRPAIINPRPVPNGTLVTPDNSDLSAPSSSDLSGSGTEAETDSESDTATEMGDSIHDPASNEHELNADHHEIEVDGYVTVPPHRQVDSTLGMRSPTLESAMDELRVSELSLSRSHALERTYSNSSSQYASSEGASEGGSDFGMADSLTLPALPGNGGNSGAGGTGGTALGRGWVSTFDNGPIDLGAPPIPASGSGSRRVQLAGLGGRKGWQEKPTFFEYLYGA